MIKTGGASGADFHWARVALLNNYHVEIITFTGHQLTLPQEGYVLRNQTQKNLFELEDLVEKTSIARGQKMTKNVRVYNLIARNYFIVQDVDAVFAIGYFSPTDKSLGIDGGTGWGCEYYVNNTEPENVNLFLFEQNENYWYKYDAVNKKWNIIGIPSIHLFHNIAGVGSRKITEGGIKMIEKLFTK
jgi:hypothetical protein